MTLLSLYELTKDMLLSGANAGSRVMVDNGRFTVDLTEIILDGASRVRDEIAEIAAGNYTLV